MKSFFKVTLFSFCLFVQIPWNSLLLYARDISFDRLIINDSDEASRSTTTVGYGGTLREGKATAHLPSQNKLTSRQSQLDSQNIENITGIVPGGVKEKPQTSSDTTSYASAPYEPSSNSSNSTWGSSSTNDDFDLDALLKLFEEDSSW